MYDMDRLKAEITRLFYARMDRGGHTPEEIRQLLAETIEEEENHE